MILSQLGPSASSAPVAPSAHLLATTQDTPQLSLTGGFGPLLASLQLQAGPSDQIKLKTSKPGDLSSIDITRTVPDSSQVSTRMNSFLSSLGLVPSIPGLRNSVGTSQADSASNPANPVLADSVAVEDELKPQSAQGSLATSVRSSGTGKARISDSNLSDPSNLDVAALNPFAVTNPVPSTPEMEFPVPAESSDLLVSAAVAAPISMSALPVAPDITSSQDSKRVSFAPQLKQDLKTSRTDSKNPKRGLDISSLQPIQPLPVPGVQSLEAPESRAAGAGKGSEMGSVPVLAAGASAPDASMLTIAASSPQSSTPVTGKLAFALRVTPETGSHSNLADPSPAPPAESGSGPHAIAAVPECSSGSHLSKDSEHHEDRQNESALPAGHEAFGDAFQPAQPKTEEDVPKLQSSDWEMDKPISQEPVRDVHLQLTGSANQRVDLHLSDRGGQLHVSVRSPDQNLAQSLQERIPDLTSKLQQHRFGTEVYIPRSSESSSSNNASANNGSSAAYSNADPNSSNRQRNRRFQQAPEWVDELDSQTSKSLSRTNKTWLQ